MNTILVDSDILIDITHQDATAIARLTSESQVAELSITAITVMELIVGCRNKSELATVNRFLTQFHCLKLTPAVADRATELMQTYFLSHGLRIADALIAATAIENRVPLLSKNQRDFRFIAALNLLSYP